jgi:ligand-binding SRPBCC domain-containing protein
MTGPVLFVHESRIEAPPEVVFAFHERPDALQRLVPPWERVEIVRPPSSLAPGTRVVLRMRVGPFGFTWEAEHTLYQRAALFQDRMLRGPFRRWVHTHRFLPAAPGATTLRDEVEYEIPRYAFVAAPLIGRRLRRMFEYRHRVTKDSVREGSP